MVWFLVWVWPPSNVITDPSFSILLLSNFDGYIGLCACLLVVRRLPQLQASHLDLKCEKRCDDEEAFLLSFCLSGQQTVR